MGAQGRVSQCSAVGLRRVWVVLPLLLGVLGALPRAAGRSENSPAADQNSDSAELTSNETQPTFKVQVERNLVIVRVVVRDSKGRTVRDLQKEDFRLFDNGKPQSIVHFAVEDLSSKPEAQANAATQRPVDTEALPETALAASMAQRYMALYFDDVHANFGDLARSRDAADRYLASSLQPGDRAGIFTSSGQTTLDFTDDRAKLRQALFRLLPRPIMPEEEDVCPQIFDYQAYMIVHRRDPYAIEIATQEAFQCDCANNNIMTKECEAQAQGRAEGEAVRILSRYQTESEYALRGLEQLVRRVSVVPGQRNIVLVSPGFLTETEEMRVDDIVNRALRSDVVINTLDAKGLFAPIPLGDASRRPMVIARRADLMGEKAQLQLAQVERAADVLRNLAYDTGGVFFQNNNDFDEGFRKVGVFPEMSYVLGFSPQNLKLDGRFHTLKVKLVKPASLTVQARRGYFAPKQSLNASTQVKEEIEQAVFSQEELNEIPVQVHTQFFKINDTDAKLSVLMHLDMRFLRFRKEQGRNLDNLTVVTALFDRDGKYLTAKEKLLDFHLRDSSLEQLTRTGLNMKTSFDVKPGTYLVREVVRDAQGGQLSGLNRTIEIPF